MPNLVEGPIVKVYLKDKEKYAYVLRGSPHLSDPKGGVLEA
jgi:hypothetical protein